MTADAWPGLLVIALVAAQRIGELALAKRNTARLKAEGAVEHGAAHYPLFVILHGGWLVALAAWVTLEPAPLAWPWLIVFLLLQAGRVWVIRSLGRYWTTRVIDVPGAALSRRGPYRWLRHPNYVVVTLEIAVLPLALGAWPLAVVFSIPNALLLWHRIGVENTALAARRQRLP